MVKSKPSFTILETLISLIIISLLVSSFYKLLQDIPNIHTYQEIQKEENEYNQK